MRKMAAQLNLSIDALMGLGRVNPKNDAESFLHDSVGS
jgi:hypothetical protein